MPAGRDQVRPMQRLVRIMAVLDQAGNVGATRDQLVKVADYGDADPGSQLALDLKHLRSHGWQIDNIAGTGVDARYRMVPGDNRLRLKLSAGQWGALQRAVIVSDREDLARRLGIRPAALPKDVGTHLVPRTTSPDLSLALEAVQLRCRITFSYKGTRRSLSPGSVRFQNYGWYLSGIEDGGDTIKHFAVNRMSDTVLDKPGSADPVPRVRAIPLHPLEWEVDPEIRVVIRAVADYVPDVERWLNQPDESVPGEATVDLTYTVTNRAAFRARLYVLGDRVTVVGPDEFRTELLTELRRMAG